MTDKLPKKLTKEVVTAADPSTQPGKRVIVWDSIIAGFGLVVFPSGAKSFIYQYRNAEGQSRRFTIGAFSESLTCDQARKIAKDKANEVHNGKDPMAYKKSRREALTVNQLLDQYLASPTFAKKAESTKYVDKGRVERHVRPLLGSSHADLLTADAVRRAQNAITQGKTAGSTKTKARGVAKVTGGAGTADKAVLILRAAYSWAISEGILKDNPAATVKVSQPGQRDAIMGGSKDYETLFDTLAKMENEHRIRPAAADAIRFITLTGARKGEVIGMIWAYVDLRAGTVTIPPNAHKTGSRTGKPRIITLPAAAQAIIARQPEGEPTDYVFKPAKGEGAMALTKPWRQVRNEAKLPDNLGLHGLRHSLASHLAMDGASSAELMESLGHKQVSTTMRYIHFAEKSKSTLAERAAATALAGLADSLGKTRADVVPMKKPKKSNTAA